MAIPPIEFLFDASLQSLQDAELAALNRCSNLGKRLRVEMDAWIEETASALTIRWMIEKRSELMREGSIATNPHKVEIFSDIKKRA